VLPVIQDLIHKHPDAIPGGKSTLSTAPGESYNSSRARVLGVIQQAWKDFLRQPNSIIVLVLHRSGISTAHGWVAKGAPADLSVDPHHVTAEREEEPVYRLAPGKRGKPEIKPVRMQDQKRNRPGIYLVPHGETEMNK
jgi:broad specificity phosphatase PhoE